MNAPASIAHYKTLVFDCDGVILNSNRVKTEAFYQTALPYGSAAAQRLVDYHVSHGGISRYAKFALFLAEMTDGRSGPRLEELLDTYATQVKKELLACEVMAGLDELKSATVGARWMVVSGGAQTELREVFAARGLDTYFEAGIFGSPDVKEDILDRERAAGSLTGPALFIGDSVYDHKAATGAGLDFVFAHGWTEVPGWKQWSEQENVRVIPHPAALLTA